MSPLPATRLNAPDLRRAIQQAQTPARLPANALDGAPQANASLAELAAHRLWRDIVSGAYSPGEHIREPEVSARLGISRAPVREALRMLEHDGMLTVEAFRGARVINPDATQISNLFQMLGAVEGVTARLTIEQGSDADLQAYGAAVQALADAHAAGASHMTLVDLAFASGAVLVRASRCPLAAAMVRKMAKPAYWLHRYLDGGAPDWQRESVRLHQPLREAVLARQPDAAERCARVMVEHARRGILVRLHQQRAPADPAISTAARNAAQIHRERRTPAPRARPETGSETSSPSRRGSSSEIG